MTLCHREAHLVVRDLAVERLLAVRKVAGVDRLGLRVLQLPENKRESQAVYCNRAGRIRERFTANCSRNLVLKSSSRTFSKHPWYFAKRVQKMHSKETYRVQVSQREKQLHMHL